VGEQLKTMEAAVQNLTVKRITDARDLDKITDWMYGWWGKAEGYAYDAVRCCMQHSLQTNRLPQTFGLYEGDALIGMYQFTNEDLFPRPDIYPWLANVYLDPRRRGLGYGRFLLSTVQRSAASIGLSELYLFTEHTGLYEKFGWTFVETIDTFLQPRLQRLYRLEIGAENNTPTRAGC